MGELILVAFICAAVLAAVFCFWARFAGRVPVPGTSRLLLARLSVQSAGIWTALMLAGAPLTPVLMAQTAHFSVGESTMASGLNGANGVEVDASGNVYIADSFNRRVLKETLSGGTYTESVIADASTLGRPDGLAIDASGNVYIADYANEQVVKD